MDEILEKDSSDQHILNRLHSFLNFKNTLQLVLILIFVNLIYLDLVFIKGSNITTIEKVITAPITNQKAQSDCDSNCIDKKINAAISSIKITPEILPTGIPTPTPTKAVIQTFQNSSSQAPREYYVPFGSGSGNSSDWTDVSGLLASVDSSSYPNIQNVVFEVSLHVPTGNETASVRLYNATDQHPVWNSQIDFTGSSQSVLKVSQPITLDSGSKTYQVQILTQLNYPAVIDQSRLHITTK